jgi:hypothetical protein
MAPTKQSGLTEARKKIHEQIRAAEEAAKASRSKHRLGLASKGASAYATKNLGEAAQSFMAYIKILEDMKGVPQGGLSPANFDRKTDLSEMMLVSGVYWELTKLYDRTASPEKQAEFRKHLGKYIQFSKGMPYQTMCSEHMRKYIQASQALHRKEFKDAYKLIAISKCFVATELIEYIGAETLPDLRSFRDQVLKESGAGRKFVARYYRSGPMIAERVSHWPEPMKQGAGKTLDWIASATKAYRRIVPVRNGRK